MKEEIYTVYAPAGDMTFIMRDVYNGEEIASTSVIGWYYGEPNNEATKKFAGKLIAEF